MNVESTQLWQQSKSVELALPQEYDRLGTPTYNNPVNFLGNMRDLTHIYRGIPASVKLKLLEVIAEELRASMEQNNG